MNAAPDLAQPAGDRTARPPTLPQPLRFELWRRIDRRLRRGDVLVADEHFVQEMEKDFAKIVGVPPSPRLRAALEQMVTTVNHRYPNTYLSLGIKNAVTLFLRGLQARLQNDSDDVQEEMRHRIKTMVKEGRTAFFLDSIGVDMENAVVTPAIEAAILKIVDGQKLRAPSGSDRANKPRRRPISPLLAQRGMRSEDESKVRDHDDEVADEDGPAQAAMPDAKEAAERESREEYLRRKIAEQEMDKAGDYLDTYENRGMLDHDEVVNLREIFDVEGRLKRGEINEEQAEKLRQNFDEVLRKKLEKRLHNAVDASAMLISAFEAMKRLSPHGDAAIAFLAKNKTAVMADEDNPLLAKLIEALDADTELLEIVGRVIDRKDHEFRMMAAKLTPYRQLLEATGGMPDGVPKIKEDFMEQVRGLSREELSQLINADEDGAGTKLLDAGRGLIALVDRVIDESPFHREVRRLKIRQTLVRIYESTAGGKEGRHKVQHFLKRRLHKLYPSITKQESAAIEAESTEIMEAIDRGERPTAAKDEGPKNQRVYRA